MHHLLPATRELIKEYPSKVCSNWPCF